MNDDLLNAPCGACNHGRAAGHCFKVDDSERLVDGGATENARMAIQLDCLLLGHHFLDPDNTRVLAACVLDLLPQLRGYLRSIRCPSAKHYLRLPRQVANCIDKVSYALLPSDTAQEQDVGHGRIDTMVRQRLEV